MMHYVHSEVKLILVGNKQHLINKLRIYMKNFTWKLIIILSSFLFMHQSTYAWYLHTLIAHPIFSSMDAITSSDSVTVTSINEFLLAVEQELESSLLQEEQWARENLDYYSSRPNDLIFQATGNPADIRQRFIEAIRINPDSKLISYLQLLPGADPGDQPILKATDITPLKKTRGYNNVRFVGLNNGALVDPLSVLVTANDEPDMGLDIGLYEDNNTTAGKTYGFGSQPFGNPNLEYSSQAPLHMGLYHEAKLINRLAPFMKECYPEYRIHQYKTLSELAFKLGQDYWGWRFMGWGLHYIADLAQSYHTSALPGVSTAKMILMNSLDMLGSSRMKNNAIQLVSNRHTAIEAFGRQLLEKAYLGQDQDYLQIQSLSAQVSVPKYEDSFPRNYIAQASNAQAKSLDRAIARGMPHKLVSDPSFELGNSDEQYEILSIMQKLENPAAISDLETQLNDLLQLFSIYGRSYVLSILSIE